SDAASKATASDPSPVAGLVSAMNGDNALANAAVPVPSASIAASASATSLAKSPAHPQAVTRHSPPPLKVISEIVKNGPVEKHQSEKLRVESTPGQVSKPEPELFVASPEPQRHKEPQRDQEPHRNKEPQRDQEPQRNKEPQRDQEPQRNKEPQRHKEPVPEFSPANWTKILEALSLSGVAASLAANCELYSANDHRCVLKLSENHASLWNKTYESRIAEALGRLYGQEINVSIEVGAPSVETPAQGAEREKQQSLAQAVADIQGDQHVQQLIESFNGKLDPKSITPLGN
ncbi:MAG: hypothetical protein HOJ11_00410, partial [Gammaproteobacteria bacterium]|nr:hypothetical protein [Gammaproteobacteria bacterium]